MGTYNQTVEAGVQGTKCVKGSVPQLYLSIVGRVFTSEQCKSACGIFLLSREAVTMKLAPSQIFTSTRKSKEEVQSIKCDNCGHSISASPLIRNSLRAHFRGVLEVNKQPLRARSNTPMRIEGEVITSDEYLEYQLGQRKGKVVSAQETAEATSTHSDSEGKKLYYILYI